MIKQMKPKVNSYIYFSIVILGLLFGNNFVTYSRNDINECNQALIISELIVCDTNIYYALERIINEEKEINIHFTDSTVFGVWVTESLNNECFIITITGTDNLNMLVQIGDFEGFFKYKGHYFILMTECSKLFHDSGDYQTLDIDTSLDIYEDDRWPFHYIKYCHGAFIPIEH
jgi:hypothetical protein